SRLVNTLESTSQEDTDMVFRKYEEEWFYVAKGPIFNEQTNQCATCMNVSTLYLNTHASFRHISAWMRAVFVKKMTEFRPHSHRGPKLRKTLNFEGAMG